MIKKYNNLKTDVKEQMRGGDGSALLRQLMTPEEMYGANRLFSTITLNPGCSIGYHEHQGESEIFYIVSGNGLFNDNGTESEVAPGDVCVTASGSGHSIACAGDSPLVMVALIVLAK